MDGVREWCGQNRENVEKAVPRFRTGNPSLTSAGCTALHLGGNKDMINIVMH